MQKIYILLILLFTTTIAWAQVNLQPTVMPATFDPLTEITVTYDVSGTALEDLANAYIWVWIPGSNIDARYNVNPASGNTELTENAKFTKTVEGGTTTFSLTFVPQNFFVQPICAETQIGMLIKGNDWSNGQSNDHVRAMTPLASCFVVKLLSPTSDPAFISPGGTLTVSAESNDPATFTLSVDGQEVDEQDDITDYEFEYAIPQSEGIYPVSLHVGDGENDTTITFSYLVNSPSEDVDRPVGIIPGINYHPDDHTTVTLCLLAPGKDAVYILGEFNDFEIIPENKMYKDGDHFWVEINGLTAGQEYAFQYLVDGVFVADPFAEKILDPDDHHIHSSIYPSLKQYPAAALHGQWYKNRLAVLKTNQTPFNWQHTDFQRPDKSDLVIYELLIRDFFAPNDRNYVNLIDTLSYLKRLGVNAIELMPVQEFAGNNSWGYNPTFMFAADKAYGTRQALKQFIDAAHEQGMAVILDIVFNHQDVPNSYAAMWFNFNNYQVLPENPMFNVTATHPFSVFYDMNHESELTQYYMDTTLHYWINEYKVDGFRFDLSKGFTQKNTGSNVGSWGQYDASRVALLKRMADKVWEYDPDVYLILEHFADNNEETELADYGFMLWGNMHWDYKDLALGIEKNISWAYHGTRGWQQPNLVAYMESHDEQRIMYELLNYGQSSGGYNTQNFKTALDRVKAAKAFLYTIPGPKLLWQFGELGYEFPINLCEDGTSINDGCRTSVKPVRWDYYQEEDRNELFRFTQALFTLKTSHEVFKTGQFSMTNSNSFVKEITLINKDNIASPANSSEMSVYIIGNFDVQSRDVTAKFPFTGTWYNFFEGGEEVAVSNAVQNFTFNPGEFRLYVNYPIDFPEPGLAPTITSLNEKMENDIRVYPNPSTGLLNIRTAATPGEDYAVKVHDMMGRTVYNQRVMAHGDTISLDLANIPAGVYLINISGRQEQFSTQFIKR